MGSRSLFLAVLLALGGLGSLGCSDGGGGGAGGSSGSGGAGTGGSGGDTPLLPAPPANQGVQFNVPSVMVPPGQESQVCLYLKLPWDVEFFFDHIQMETTDGGRHLYVFKNEYFDHDEGFVPDCFTPVDTNQWAVVVQSQNQHLDWTLPDGVAFRLRRLTQLMVIAHYYNTGSAPISGRATINLWSRDPATVQHWGNVVVAVQNNISIPPSQSLQVKQHFTLPVDTAETAPANRIHPTHILALSGDFHRTGRDFHVVDFHLSSTVGCPPTCPGTEGTTAFYDTTDGMKPLMQIFAAGTEPVIANQDGFSFTCNYQNDSSSTVVFGPRVLTQEHCTLFTYFYPAPMDGMTLGCTEITGAW